MLVRTLENGNDSDAHLLSATLREYYNNTGKLTNRFKQIAWSLDVHNRDEAYRKITEYADLDSGTLGFVLAGFISKDVRLAVFRALADFIY